jgi:hypothetical protein
VPDAMRSILGESIDQDWIPDVHVPPKVDEHDHGNSSSETERSVGDFTAYLFVKKKSSGRVCGQRRRGTSPNLPLT